MQELGRTRTMTMTREGTELLLSIACIVVTGFSKIPQILELSR